MKVLVTGGSGQVGSYLSEKLAGEGHEVTVLGRSVRPDAGGPKISLVNGDVRDRDLAGRLAKGSDAIVHCAAQNSPELSIRDPAYDAEVNIMGTLNLLEAARRAGISRFICFSSAAVYGNGTRAPVKESDPLVPASPYGVSKLCGEKYAMAFHDFCGLPAVVIRPFNIYSPREDPARPYSSIIAKVVERVGSGKPPLVNGVLSRDFVSVHDVVDLVMLALEKDEAVGKVFNCGTGIGTDIGELARMVISMYGRDDMEPEFHQGVSHHIRQSVADISYARRVLGYEPRVTLFEGLKEVIGCKPLRPGTAAGLAQTH